MMISTYLFKVRQNVGKMDMMMDKITTLVKIETKSVNLMLVVNTTVDHSKM